MANSMLKIQNTEGGGKVFNVPVEAAKQSSVISMLLEDYGDTPADIIPITTTVSDACLEKVFAWATHHKDDPPPVDDVPVREMNAMAVRDGKMSAKEQRAAEEAKRRAREARNQPVVIAGWDEEFFTSIDSSMLYEILIAANYLEFRSLLDMGCQAVVNMIHGKSVEEVRKILNIKNDFTPAEEEQIRAEVAWTFDSPGRAESSSSRN